MKYIFFIQRVVLFFVWTFLIKGNGDAAAYDMAQIPHVLQFIPDSSLLMKLHADNTRLCQKKYPTSELQKRSDLKTKVANEFYNEARKNLETAMKNFDNCMIAEQKKQSFEIPVYEKPFVGKKLGSVVIFFTDSDGVAFKYVKVSGVYDKFSPDIFDPDIFYGSIYQTIIGRTGDWLKLPRVPFPTPVWINWKATFGRSPSISNLFELGEINIDNKAVIFLNTSGEKIKARGATGADMDCEGKYTEAEKSHIIKVAPIYFFSKKQLFDKNYHFKGKLAHTRGC